MIKASVARSLNITIDKLRNTVNCRGRDPHKLVTCQQSLTLDALVVEDLDVDILVGIPILIANDVSVRPTRCQVRIQDSETLHYRPSDNLSSQPHVVRRTQSYTPYVLHLQLLYGQENTWRLTCPPTLLTMTL